MGRRENREVRPMGPLWEGPPPRRWAPRDPVRRLDASTLGPGMTVIMGKAG